MVPTLKWYPRILMPGLLVEFLQFSMRNDSHIALINTKIHKYSVSKNFLSEKFLFTEHFKSVHVLFPAMSISDKPSVAYLDNAEQK